MKNKNIYFVIIILLIANVILILGIEYKNREIKIISEKYLVLENDIINCQNITKDMLHITESNMKQAYFPLIIKNGIFKKEVESSTSPKVYVRFSMDFCGSCLNEMYIYLKEIASEIGEDKIVLLPICKDKKESVFFRNKFGSDFPYVHIDSSDLYMDNILEPLKPYFFVYEKDLKFPILFSWFYNEFIELNGIYKRVLFDYFDNDKKIRKPFEGGDR